MLGELGRFGTIAVSAICGVEVSISPGRYESAFCAISFAMSAASYGFALTTSSRMTRVLEIEDMDTIP